MSTALRIGLVLVLCSATWACSGDSEEGDARGWEPGLTAKVGGDGDGTCDGTGDGTGAESGGGGSNRKTPARSGEACKPKTCQELGQGTHDDGCGRQIDCGAAICTDAKTGNASANNAADLGTLTDNPATSRLIADLALADGEEDWFQFKVTDSGFGGNPLIEASVSSALEVSVYYVCDSAPDYSECSDGSGTEDNAIGKGCRATGNVSLVTECSWLNETGRAFVRVRKAAADGACSKYTLNISVD
jgi:hypothetical protein